MPRPTRYQDRIELLQGTLDLLILQTLTDLALHGYGIMSAIRRRSREALRVDTGSVYPALHRLERQRLIRSEWTVSENNQRVKLYRLTAAGRKRLAVERSRWEQFAGAVHAILNPLPEQAG